MTEREVEYIDGIPFVNPDGDDVFGYLTDGQIRAQIAADQFTAAAATSNPSLFNELIRAQVADRAARWVADQHVRIRERRRTAVVQAEQARLASCKTSVGRAAVKLWYGLVKGTQAVVG